MKQYNLPDWTALNSENTQSLVKLYWNARRQMEIPQVPEHYILLRIFTHRILYNLQVPQVLGNFSTISGTISFLTGTLLQKVGQVGGKLVLQSLQPH
jgi:hypothetical protein